LPECAGMAIDTIVHAGHCTEMTRNGHHNAAIILPRSAGLRQDVVVDGILPVEAWHCEMGQPLCLATDPPQHDLPQAPSGLDEILAHGFSGRLKLHEQG
jgi:hypothetical protein